MSRPQRPKPPSTATPDAATEPLEALLAQQTRLLARALRAFADVLDEEGEAAPRRPPRAHVANDAPAPPRPRCAPPLYRPAADVTDLDRERADRALKRRGFLTLPAKKAPR